MSAILRCDSCGASWDTGGTGHVCQPEDLCEKLEGDIEGMAGDMLSFENRLRRIEKFCENTNSRAWHALAGMVGRERGT